MHLDNSAPGLSDNPLDMDYELARCANASLAALHAVLRAGGVPVPRPDEFFAAPTPDEREESRRFIRNPRGEG